MRRLHRPGTRATIGRHHVPSRTTAKDLAELPLLARRRAARIVPLIERGDCWLHVARDGDRLVGYRFATRGYWGHGVLARFIRPAPDQVYIEDVFVNPDAWGRGIGKAIFAHLAARALAQGCGRMEWSVLDWNTPAIDFYKSLGAHPQDEWTTYRLTDEALTRLGS